MDSTALLSHFRAQVMDEVKPFLWSTPEGLAYMNEAQLMFCRLTEGISDVKTPEVCAVPVATGEIFAEVHPAIKHFRLATVASTGAELQIKNHTDVHKWTNQTGRITKMIVGLQPGLVRWDYAPAADDEVNLFVFRLPLTDITDVDQELEIEAKHHVSLVHWMKHLAYLKQDSQTYDGKTSEQSRKDFLSYCAQVKTEQEYYKHTPTAVGYGGI